VPVGLSFDLVQCAVPVRTQFGQEQRFRMERYLSGGVARDWRELNGTAERFPMPELGAVTGTLRDDALGVLLLAC
jgi:hypothetical protein